MLLLTVTLAVSEMVTTARAMCHPPGTGFSSVIAMVCIQNFSLVAKSAEQVIL